MNKLRLDNVTIVIPCRLDSIVRLENIIIATSYLLKEFNVNIIVTEADTYNNLILQKLLPQGVKYQFCYDEDPIYFRTHYINMICSELQTGIVGIWDADVLVPSSQIIKAVELLSNDEADFVYPYEKYALDTSPILRKMFLQNPKIEFLERNMKKMKEMYPPNPVGGAFMANLESYKESGLENESFYGWGLQDGERFYRWGNMGYRIKRVPGPLFHLSHPRGQNSNFHDVDQPFMKKKEVISVKRNKIFKENIAEQ